MFLKCKSIYNCDCIHTHLLQLPFSVYRGGRGHEVRSYSVHIIYILQYTIMATSSSGSKVSLEHCQGNL